MDVKSSKSEMASTGLDLPLNALLVGLPYALSSWRGKKKHSGMSTSLEPDKYQLFSRLTSQLRSRAYLTDLIAGQDGFIRGSS